MESVAETMRVESPPSIRYRSQYPVNVTSLPSSRMKSTTPRWPLDCITAMSGQLKTGADFAFLSKKDIFV